MATSKGQRSERERLTLSGVRVATTHDVRSHPEPVNADVTRYRGSIQYAGQHAKRDAPTGPERAERGGALCAGEGLGPLLAFTL